MDSLKKMLGREIPFEKAAAYFVGLKRPAIEAEDAPVLEEAAQKLAAAEESVEQQISRLSPLQRAQLGAAYAVMGAREEDQPGVAAPALGGAGGGAAAGGALGAGLGALARVATRGRVKLPTRQAAGAGAALGALAGGHQGFGVGKERKQEYQGETQQLARGALGAVPEMAQLSAQHGGAPVELRDGNRSYGTVRGVPTQHGIMPVFSPKTAALLSKLAEGAPPMEAAQEVPMASPSPLAAPDVQSYMEQEMMGSRQEMEAALGFYQQKLEEARAQTEEATQQAQQAMQLAEQLQAQQAQSAMQQQQLQQQAVEAGNRSLEAKANESQMTMQLQALREQLLTLATNVGAPLGGPQPGDPQPEPQVGPDGQPVPAEGVPSGQEQAAQGAPEGQGAQPAEGGVGGQASSPTSGGGQKPGGVTVKVSSADKAAAIRVSPATAALLSAASPASVGAAAGGLMAPEGRRMEGAVGGALSGAMGGTLGGLVGRTLGHPVLGTMLGTGLAVKGSIARNREAHEEDQFKQEKKRLSREAKLRQLADAGGGQKKEASIGKVLRRSGELVTGIRADDYRARALGLARQAQQRAAAGGPQSAAPTLKALGKVKKLHEREAMKHMATEAGLTGAALGGGLALDRRRRNAAQTPAAQKVASPLAALRNPANAGMAVGGALGLAAGGAEAAGLGPDLDKIRARIAENETAAKEPGVGGFRKALDLAKDRALLTLGEAAQDHPVMSTLAGGALGAAAGYRMGPQFAGKINEAKRLHGR